MFCPKCKSIIGRKRIPNQGIVEYCNCPDKPEPKFIPSSIPSSRKTTKKQTIYIKEKSQMRNVKKFVNLESSDYKPKREPSDYQNIPLKYRINEKTPLPLHWDRGIVAKRLQKSTEEKYERFYRKIEDFFTGSELEVCIILTPNPVMTDFTVDKWGIGVLINGGSLFKWYEGTKLNDLGSFDAKVLEKESDIFLPSNFEYSSVNFDRINLKNLCEILLNKWNEFKFQNHIKNPKKPSLPELYEKWRKE